MSSAMLSLIVAGCLLPGGARPSAAGTLIPEQGDSKKARQYIPREGDMVFFDDHSLTWNVLFAWAGTGPPLHVGIVVRRYDGSLAILEAGPDDSIWVTIQPVASRLAQFDRDFHGTVTIRRCRMELTEKQSRGLTQFAEAQEGKRYAVIRLLLQGTPFRCRGPIREFLLASTELDRWSWICSELVVAAATVAEICPKTVKANVTYPLDLVNNRRHDLSLVWLDGEIWRPAAE